MPARSRERREKILLRVRVIADRATTIREEGLLAMRLSNSSCVDPRRRVPVNPEDVAVGGGCSGGGGGVSGGDGGESE